MNAKLSSILRVGGGFQLHCGLFPLWQSGGIAFGFYSDFGVFLRYGIHHNNRPVPSSNNDKQRKQRHSNDTEFGLNTDFHGNFLPVLTK